MSTLAPLSSIISQTEGYGVPNAIPTVANNPGDLENGDIGYGTLTTSDGGQVTVYNTLADGQAALNNQLTMMQNGTSAYYNPSEPISQANQTYSGSATAWANALGIDPSTPLGQVLGAVNGTVNGVTSTVSGATGGSSKGITGHSLEDFVTIVVGLILIAAGVFSFKSAQTVVNTSIKVAKRGAEVAS
jgi:hypothetical protein